VEKIKKYLKHPSIPFFIHPVIAKNEAIWREKIKKTAVYPSPKGRPLFFF
jgi:hypothetical protein